MKYILLLLLLPLVVAENLQATLVINSSHASFQSQGMENVYPLNVNGSYNLALPVNGTGITTNDLKQFFINESRISEIVNNEIDLSHKAEHDYFANTFLPSQESLDSCEDRRDFLESDIKECDFLNDQLKLSRDLWNQSVTMHMQDLQKENSHLSWLLSGMLLIAIAFIGYHGYIKVKRGHERVF